MTSVISTSRTELRMETVVSWITVQIDRWRQRCHAAIAGSCLLMLSTTWMTLAPGCWVMVHQNGRLAVGQAHVADILDPVIDLGHVLEPDRRIVAIGDDQVLVVRWPPMAVSLAIDLKAAGYPAAIAPLGLLAGIGRGDRGAHVFQPDAVFEQGARIEFDADRRQRGAVQRNIAHAGNLRQFLLQDVGGLVVDLARASASWRSAPGS